MTEMPPSFQPFNTIGLCFSGGGYRATFFALGVVSYLEHIQYKGKPLLESVSALSTVSGGTLLGVAYARAVQESDYQFQAFFKQFYQTFTPENDRLLQRAVENLTNDAIWEKHPHKKRSLINAFALTYAEMDVFKGDFEIFKKDSIRQLKQVCFNATEFSFGMTYRFQNEGYFGNNPLYKNNQKEVNALRYQLQLSDVIASSSCFPLGFEPLVFPDDYFSKQDTVAYKNLKGLPYFQEGIGIMDGGIADNQGIGSMMLINERMEHGFDLVMVNDVGSYKMDPWLPDTKESKNDTSLRSAIQKVLGYFNIRPLYVVLLVLGIVVVVANSFFDFRGHSWTAPYIVGSILIGIGLTLTTIGGIARLLKGTLLSRLKNLFRKNVPIALADDVLRFQYLSTGLLQRMLTERATSAAKMINDVFLKQLRRLNYDLFYSKEALKYRRLTATVYKLNGQDTTYTNSADPYNPDIHPKPSTSLKNVCLTASEMPTTLWWSQEDRDKNRMDSLIACGQFTVCYELMDYILKLKANNVIPPEDAVAIDDLYVALQRDWEQFNHTPVWLVEEYKAHEVIS